MLDIFSIVPNTNTDSNNLHDDVKYTIEACAGPMRYTDVNFS